MSKKPQGQTHHQEEQHDQFRFHGALAPATWRCTGDEKRLKSGVWMRYTSRNMRNGNVSAPRKSSKTPRGGIQEKFPKKMLTRPRGLHYNPPGVVRVCTEREKRQSSAPSSFAPQKDSSWDSFLNVFFSRQGGVAALWAGPFCASFGLDPFFGSGHRVCFFPRRDIRSSGRDNAE